MDIKCPHCLEPIDMDEFHYMSVEDVSENYRNKYLRLTGGDKKEYRWKAFISLYKQFGCSLLDGYNSECKPHAKPESAKQAAVRDIYYLLGDDIDGAASMLEDMDMFDFD